MDIIIFYTISTIIVVTSEYNFFKTATKTDKIILVLLWPLACVVCIFLWFVMLIEDLCTLIGKAIKGA